MEWRLRNVLIAGAVVIVAGIAGYFAWQHFQPGAIPTAAGQAPEDLKPIASPLAQAQPDDIVEAVRRGIDMFDCVLPTRSGRTGQAFTADGPINIRNAKFAEDHEPIEPGCPCPTCTQFERAYVHHLVRSGEILGAMLMTEHNLWFYQRLMRNLRDAIAEAQLTAFAGGFLERYRRNR